MSGIHPEVILAGRRINDNMGKYIAEQTIKQINKLRKTIHGAKIGILGLTFKENCGDIRNTKVIDIVHELKHYHADVILHDPRACAEETKHYYDLTLSSWEDFNQLDAIILAVAHDSYLRCTVDELSEKLNHPKLIIDIKSAFNHHALRRAGIHVWRL